MTPRVSGKFRNIRTGLLLEGTRGELTVIRGNRANPVRNLDMAGIPRGVWYTNLSERSCALISGRNRNHLFLQFKDLGLSLNEVICEWNDSKKICLNSAWKLLRIVERACGLFDEVICELSGETHGQLVHTSQERAWREMRQIAATCCLRRKPGESVSHQLSSGIFAEFKSQVGLSLARSFQAKERNERIGSTAIASIPKFAYLDRLARLPFPDASEWRKLELPGRAWHIGESEVEEIRKFGKPAILVGRPEFKPGHLGRWPVTFFAPGNNAYGRSFHTLNETEFLISFADFHAEDIYVGVGMPGTVSGGRLKAYRDALANVCGGELIASNSWSAGVAAARLLSSIVMCDDRLVSDRTLEPVWIASLDRVLMFPIAEAIGESGCRLFSSFMGSIVFMPPENLQSAARLYTELWKAGVILTFPDSPSDHSEIASRIARDVSFGGVKDSSAGALAIQTGLHRLMSCLDSILDLPPGQRSRAFNSRTKNLTLSDE